jgi:hypothetical protein
MARPRPVYDGGSPPFGGGCAPARYARLRFAAPEGGLGGVKKSNLQNNVYTSTLKPPSGHPEATLKPP